MRRAGDTLHRSARASHYCGLSLRSTGSRHAGSVVVAHGPSCSVACGIFPDQGSNPYPLYWQADSQPLHHQGSPYFDFSIYYFTFLLLWVFFSACFFSLLLLFFLFSSGLCLFDFWLFWCVCFCLLFFLVCFLFFFDFVSFVFIVCFGFGFFGCFL